MKEMAYLYLAIAIVGEVIGTSLLKATGEFTKLVPSVLVVVSYVASFYFMTLVFSRLLAGRVSIWQQKGFGIYLTPTSRLAFSFKF